VCLCVCVRSCWEQMRVRDRNPERVTERERGDNVCLCVRVCARALGTK